MLKRILLPLVAALVALAPAALSQPASHAAGTTTITWTDANTGPKTLTVPTGTNNCTGPLVVVYGSSALKTFVLGLAADFCAAGGAGNQATTPDVEYVGGGDSCPGLDIAADDTADNVLGVSDVFSTGCTGTFARSSSLVKDNLASTNAVESITLCSGASAVQGGSPFAGSAANQCLGSAKTLGTCPATPTGNTADYPKDFPFPDDIAVASSQSLWNQGGTGLSDMGPIGGCAGETPFVQVRQSGSGTRITWCNNIYGPFKDGFCNGNANDPDRATTGQMLSSVCGIPANSGTITFGGGASGVAPTDSVGTIGHTSRAGVLIDPRSSAAGKTTDSPSNNQPLTNCGLVSLAGHNAWNQACDPTAVTAASPYSTLDSKGLPICKGDLEIANNQYPAWGYEHLFTNAGKASSAPIVAFLNFVSANQPRADQYGFMKLCRMNWKRTVDGGPVAPQAASC